MGEVPHQSKYHSYKCLGGLTTLTINQLAWKLAQCEYRKEVAPSHNYIRSGLEYNLLSRCDQAVRASDKTTSWVLSSFIYSLSAFAC